jgi:hypothetical protein
MSDEDAQEIVDPATLDSGDFPPESDACFSE